MNIDDILQLAEQFEKMASQDKPKWKMRGGKWVKVEESNEPTIEATQRQRKKEWAQWEKERPLASVEKALSPIEQAKIKQRERVEKLLELGRELSKEKKE